MNKKRILSILIVAFMLAFASIASAEINLKTPAWQKVRDLGKNGNYVFLFIGEENAGMGKIMAGNLAGVVGRNAALVKVAPSDPLEKDLMGFFKVKANPTVVVVAPNGAVTGYYPGTADKKTLSGSLVSLKEAEALKALQEGQVVFLCFQKETSLNSDQIRADLNAVADNFKGAVSVLYAGHDDKDAVGLADKMQVRSATPTVFILTPPGRVRARLAGSEITKESLLRAFVATCGGGGCGSGCK